MRRAAARVLLVAFGVVLTVLILELGIRGAAWVLPQGDGTAPVGDDYFVVLCVGDSHTWGHGKGYPARLASVLGARSEKIRVINLGVPGTSTTRVRVRFDEWIDRYRPDLVVVFSGVNNRWNRATEDSLRIEGRSSWLDHSRLVRLARVFGEQRELAMLLDESAYVKPETRGTRRKHGTTWKQELLGGIETIANLGGARRTGEETARMTEVDLTAVGLRARERGVDLVLVTYPLPEMDFGMANEGIRSAAGATGAVLVEGSDALADLRQRYPDRQARSEYLDPSVHPRQELYDAIGDRVVLALDRAGLLPGERSARSAPSAITPRTPRERRSR